MNRRHLMFGMLSLTLLGTGCSGLENAPHPILRDHLQYSVTSNAQRKWSRVRHLANETWATAYDQARCASSPDYAQGFKDGFADQLYYGGPSTAPAVPPRRYWNDQYRSPAGYQAVQQWYAGFREGAYAGRMSGQRQLATLPSEQGQPFAAYAPRPNYAQPLPPHDGPARADQLWPSDEPQPQRPAAEPMPTPPTNPAAQAAPRTPLAAPHTPSMNPKPTVRLRVPDESTATAQQTVPQPILQSAPQPIPSTAEPEPPITVDAPLLPENLAAKSPVTVAVPSAGRPELAKARTDRLSALDADRETAATQQPAVSPAAPSAAPRRMVIGPFLPRLADELGRAPQLQRRLAAAAPHETASRIPMPVATDKALPRSAMAQIEVVEAPRLARIEGRGSQGSRDESQEAEEPRIESQVSQGASDPETVVVLVPQPVQQPAAPKRVAAKPVPQRLNRLAPAAMAQAQVVEAPRLPGDVTASRGTNRESIAIPVTTARNNPRNPAPGSMAQVQVVEAPRSIGSGESLPGAFPAPEPMFQQQPAAQRSAARPSWLNIKTSYVEGE